MSVEKPISVAVDALVEAALNAAMSINPQLSEGAAHYISENIGNLAVLVEEVVNEALTIDAQSNVVSVAICNIGGNPTPSYATPNSSGVDLQADILSMHSIAYAKILSKLDLEGRIDVVKKPEVIDGAYNLRLTPGNRALIPTGIYVAIPTGYEIQVRPRSGNAIKYGLGILNTPGTIDSDYRGELMVIVNNNSFEDILIPQGMKIAQGVLCPVKQISWASVSSPDQLPKTMRADGGFGHSDKP